MKKQSRFEEGTGGKVTAEGETTHHDEGPTRDDAQLIARKGDPIDNEFPLDTSSGPINNAATDPDSDERRSGGSPNDPDGGHELLGHEWHGPNPDPISEMLPGGQGAEAPPYRREELEASMLQDPSDAIRRRAYHLWEQAGRPHGQHEEHWRQAQAELAPVSGRPEKW